MDAIWIEKYRPLCLQDVVGNAVVVKKFQEMLNNQLLLNILLVGPPGTGKTSMLHCIARSFLGKFYNEAVLDLNVGDQRGIDVGRNLIKSFAQKKVDLPPHMLKIVILDEADAMTAGSQNVLRRIIEQYASTTRFLFACNRSDSIIEPIQSRCIMMRVNRISPEEQLNMLKKICSLENVPADDAALRLLATYSDGDFRKAIGYLQSCCSTYGRVCEHEVAELCNIAPKQSIEALLTALCKMDYKSAHGICASLIASGYQANEIANSLKRVVATTNLPEAAKQDFARAITFHVVEHEANYNVIHLQ